LFGGRLGSIGLDEEHIADAEELLLDFIYWWKHKGSYKDYKY
jgi:hypothetical protein